MTFTFLARGAVARAFAALACLVAFAAPAAAQAPAGRVTAHVLDLYTGAPAKGMKIDFMTVTDGAAKVMKSVVTNVDGRPPEGPLLTPDTIKPGRYQAVLHIADYYRSVGAKLPANFHTRLILEFDITDPKLPHHLPFQITPFTQSASVLPG
jgi:5-hydroxyisourate hydrolase